MAREAQPLAAAAAFQLSDLGAAAVAVVALEFREKPFHGNALLVEGRDGLARALVPQPHGNVRSRVQVAVARVLGSTSDGA